MAHGTISLVLNISLSTMFAIDLFGFFSGDFLEILFERGEKLEPKQAMREHRKEKIKKGGE
jgi:hypothetical protein